MDLNTGSYGTHNYELTNQGVDNDWGWFITGGIQKRGSFKYKGLNGADTRWEHSDYSNTSFSLRVDKQLTDNSSLRFNFNHRQQDMAGVNWKGIFHQEHNYNNGSLTYNFKEDQPVQGFLRYFANYKSTMNNTQYSTSTQGLDYQNGWQLGDHKLVAGAEWHLDKASNVEKNYEDKEITTTALFVQDTMSIGKKWTIVPGLRLDHHSNFGNHWSPKLAVNYQASAKTRAYASWGRVFKAPNADDMYFTEIGYYTMLGDPNLKPETGHVETIGFTHEFSEKAVFDMSYFWSELHNAIKWASEPGDDKTWHPYNIEAEKKHGINLTLNGKLSDNWSYDVGYSYIHNWRNWEPQFSYYEPNGYRLGIRYKNDRWKANIEARMGSGLNKKAYGCNNFAIWNFNTTYSATQNVDIYFKINNLTNQMYYLYPGKDYPLQGRTFLLGANVKF